MDNEVKPKRKISVKKILIFLFVIVALVVSVLLYARFIATKGVIINEYKVVNSKLTDIYKGLKIVHISDIHYKTTFDEKGLKELTDKVNLTKPDIIVITGDLLNKSVEYSKDDYEIIKKYLKEMDASIGKYAVSGDNDYNNSNLQIILDESDFIYLDDNYDLIYKEQNSYLMISGISSLQNKTDINIKLNNVNTYLQTGTPIYKILILHEPDLLKDIDVNNYDLILAGHYLGGTIRLPFVGPLVKKDGALKYNESYSKINATDLYITNGIGSDDMNYRLFNRPSINFYRLTNK